jgi:hypothetical protein
LWLHTAKCHTMYFYPHTYYTVLVSAYLHGSVCHVSLDLFIEYLVCLRMLTSELYLLQPLGFVMLKKNWNSLV